MDAAIVVVGGAPYRMDCWCRYEIERRGDSDGAGLLHAYALPPHRRMLGAGDVLARFGGDGRSSATLLQAAARLTSALEKLEDKLCSFSGAWECAPLGAPSGASEAPALTAADVREAVATPAARANVKALRELASAAREAAFLQHERVAQGGALAPSAPLLAQESFLQLSARRARPSAQGAPAPAAAMAHVTDIAAIKRLEAATLPALEALETEHASVTRDLDAAAAAIERRLEPARVRA